jgi:hypothetical protein
MLIWISRREWLALQRAVEELVQSKTRSANRRDLWLTKVIPTLCAVAVAYGTIQTIWIK